MPDGEVTPLQASATPEQQVRIEVTINKAMRAAASLLGIDHDTHAGGGTDSGQWRFSSLDDLDTVIRQWTDVRDAINDRQARIGRIVPLAQPPASDIMSQFQVQAFKNSLAVLTRQTDAMYKYADAYVAKLKQSRSGYAAAEAQNTARMKGPHG